MEVAVEFRKCSPAARGEPKQFEKLKGVYAKRLGRAYRKFVEALPEACFHEWEKDANDAFDVPLIDLLENPAETIEHLIRFVYDDDILSLNLFAELRSFLRTNLFAASGITPGAQAREPKLVTPTDQKDMSARALVEAYLGGTPFETLLELAVPFVIEPGVRFEHCHVIAGTRHGKTQFLQRMAFADLLRAPNRSGR